MPLVGLGLNQPTICSRDQRYDCRIRFSPFRHAPDPTIDYTQSDVRYVGKTKHFFGIVYGSMGALCVCADQSGRALRPPAVLELARKCFAMMSRRRRRRTQPALSRHVRFGREIPNAAGHHPKSSTSDSILMRVCFFYLLVAWPENDSPACLNSPSDAVGCNSICFFLVANLGED